MRDYNLSGDDGDLSWWYPETFGFRHQLYSLLGYPSCGWPGTGTEQTVSIAGEIAAGAYDTAPAGSYADKILLTMSLRSNSLLPHGRAAFLPAVLP